MEALYLRRFLLSLEVKELDSEDEDGVWWDIWGSSLRTVSHLSGDSESGLRTLVHLAHSLIPACDNLSNTNLAFERRSSNG